MINKKIVKSFRIDEKDNEKLMTIHQLYKLRHSAIVASGNMHNMYQWSIASTLQVLIRDVYQKLREDGFIDDKGNIVKSKLDDFE